MRLIATIALLLTAQTGGHAGAQAAAPLPCDAPEFRQLDFWLGVWDVRWDAAAGIAAGHGTNRVTRTLGDCVIQESFDGGPTTGNLIGQSLSTYHLPLKRWRQTWVDNQGGYFALVGGPEGNGFVLVSSRLKDDVPVQRMVFEEIQSDSLTWRWQKTTDGGKSWSDQWVIYYTRQPEHP
jgi:hypothetical protein